MLWHIQVKCLSVEVWGKLKVRTVGAAHLLKTLYKKRNTPYTYSLSMLSSSSQLNVARTTAMPIPLCHPTPCSKAGMCRETALSDASALGSEVWVITRAREGLPQLQSFMPWVQVITRCFPHPTPRHTEFAFKPKSDWYFPLQLLQNLYLLFQCISSFSSCKSPLTTPGDLFTPIIMWQDTSFRKRVSQM